MSRLMDVTNRQGKGRNNMSPKTSHIRGALVAAVLVLSTFGAGAAHADNGTTPPPPPTTGGTTPEQTRSHDDLGWQ
ncbi:hypothetical protein [Streptomyces sp. NPDC002054]|uniref:hypothetical protein n=1 Tax=Streptomyces sp. NPDC002054 TaxID=3154663 RepID=UPI0033192ACD